MGGFDAKEMNIDDVAFIRAIIARFQAEHHTVGNFLVGYSNGGYMAMRMALDAPDLIHGIGVIAASMPTDDNRVAAPPSRPLPVMFVNGTRDPITPYGGGRVTIFGFGDRGTVRSAVASAEVFASQLGAPIRREGPDVIQPAVANVPTSVDRQSWGGKVLLYAIHGGGHSIPQPNYRFARFVGPTEMRFNAPAAFWEFFVRTAGASDLRRAARSPYPARTGTGRWPASPCSG